MVVAPPSVREGKGVYSWRNDLPIADAPKWLVDLIIEKSRPVQPMRSIDVRDIPDVYARKALEDEGRILSQTTEGGRNAALNTAAFKLSSIA